MKTKLERAKELKEKLERIKNRLKKKEINLNVYYPAKKEIIAVTKELLKEAEKGCGKEFYAYPPDDEMLPFDPQPVSYNCGINEYACPECQETKKICKEILK